MKHIKFLKYGALLLIGLMGATSCDKSLDNPPAKLLESNYFSSEYYVQQGVAAVYAKLIDIRGGWMDRDPAGGPFTLAWLLPGDDVTFQDNSSEFETFSGLNASNGRVKGLWMLYYQAIFRANFILDKINDPSVQAVYKTMGLMDNNKGELLFLKSYANYVLWDWFRKAPIQKQRITGMADAYLDPSKDFEMLDYAISSLEEAVVLLPDAWPTGQEGRITKDGAYGLLVKCYIMRACYNGKNADDYGKAIAAFTKISDTRQLVAQFRDNFDYRTENNTESLFELQATQIQNGSNNPWLTNDSPGSSVATGVYWNNWTDHWSNYNSGICGPTQKLVNAFKTGDPRITETLKKYGWDYFSGWQIVKYVNGDRGDAYGDGGILSSNNPRVIRLADVKLAAAEAYLATGNSAEALKQVNDIRARARNSVATGKPASTVPAALGSVTMNDIMNERFLELAGEEGIRWTDLRRWHAAGYINLGTWTSADFGADYDASLFAFDVNKHLLFPIPQAELDANPKMTASGNNPGY